MGDLCGCGFGAGPVRLSQGPAADDPVCVYPIFVERVWGWTGHIIDTLAVFATLFGLATSLGYGATQANAGLNLLFGIPVGTMTEVVLITAITAVALVSVVRGLDGGVKVLSEVNMGLAVLLLMCWAIMRGLMSEKR